MIGRMLSIPEWLDYVASYQFSDLAPSRVVLHHTWRPTIEQWRGLPSMRGMQTYYGGKGWTAAPHLYIGPDGIWLFTPLREIGIHANAGNGSRKAGWYSIGIEMVGDYDHVRPSGAIWEGARAAMGGLSRRLGIAPRELISFHRDYNSTKSCPGWAITKDWVFAEVEGWLASHGSDTSAPVGPIGTPTPDVEHLSELLLDASYSRRGEGYNESWAFHLFAVQNNLGFPTARSQRLDLGGQGYNFQPFARDTLFCEIPNWGDVQRLSELLSGSIPPPGTLGHALLDATYQTGGATFHADWAFHQYAMASSSTSAPLGPPLQESKTLAVDGVTYSYQVYATDTLYNVGSEWSNIHRLSELAQASDAAQVRVREALLGAIYAAAGLQYHPEWAFHQLARTLNLGAPLGKCDPVTMGGAQYNYQSYAADTLYNVVPNWSDVKRLAELTGRRQAVLGVEGGRKGLGTLLSGEVRYDPELKEHYVVRFMLPAPSATAYRPRGRRSTIGAIVIHAAEEPAERALARMTAAGARTLSHYYVAADGQIYQLLSDRYAAKHAGLAMWEGRRRNLNAFSLGITLERTRDGFERRQIAALRDLVRTLQENYDLPGRAVVRWGDLRPSSRERYDGLPMSQIVRSR
jgi:hypothetical protein